MANHFIKEWRLHRGMTQADAAKAMGVSRPYFAMIEQGGRRWHEDFIVQAAAAFGCSVVDILVRAPGQRESIDAMLEGTNAEDRAVIEAMVRAAVAAKKPQNDPM